MCSRMMKTNVKMYYYNNKGFMQGINIVCLKQLIENMGNIRSVELMAEKFNKNYRPKINFRDFNSLLSIAQGINEYQTFSMGQQKNIRTSEKSEIFFNRELKLFCWTLLLLCQKQGVSIHNLLAISVAEINKIFTRKSHNFIAFQLRSIYFSRKKSKEPWDQQQVMLLSKIIKEEVASEWKQRAFLMFCLSEGRYFRTFQSCRENWISHLNPNIKKGLWTPAEDLQIIENVRIHGLKWSVISKLMGQARSEHSIKNRYKSLLNNLKKRVPNIDLEDVDVCVSKWKKIFAEPQKVEAYSLDISPLQCAIDNQEVYEFKEQSTDSGCLNPLVDQVQTKMTEQEITLNEQEVQCVPFISLDRVDSQFKELMSWSLQRHSLSITPRKDELDYESYQYFFTEVWIEPTNGSFSYSSLL